MDGSREDMQRMLAQAKEVIRSRTADAAARASGARIGGRAHSQHASTPSSPSGVTTATLNGKDNPKEFAQYYYRIISSYITDKSKFVLELPNLSGFDRLVVHAIADRCNLSHSSSGEGDQRVMHLRKDVLFFRDQTLYKHIDLDDILRKVSGKESRYHLRRARRVDPATLAAGEVGSYDDEDALRKIARLRRATDEYRHATDMGYTQDELLAIEGGGDESYRVEDILRRDGDAGTEGEAAPLSLEARPASQPAEPVAAAAASTLNANKTYDEICRECGSRARVDYPIARWSCGHYCAQCTRQTIWRLEEVQPKPDADSSGPQKRARDADAPVAIPRQVEEIDLEEDEPLSVADALDMAAINDFPADDINWLHHFAEHHAAHLNENLVFCIDFGDLKDLQVFLRYVRDAPADGGEEAMSSQPEGDEPRRQHARLEAPHTTSDKPCYVVVRASTDLRLGVTALLEEVLTGVFDLPAAEDGQVRTANDVIRPQDALDHVALSFVNMSVYGTEATTLCQLRPHVAKAATPDVVINMKFLQMLQHKYGAKHLYATDNLDEAIEHGSKLSV